jgi:hypothetical protein
MLPLDTGRVVPSLFCTLKSLRISEKEKECKKDRPRHTPPQTFWFNWNGVQIGH